MENKTYDVIVVGSGLAGLQAAIYAVKEAKTVLLVSEHKICSGSSFYPGTWGLGLVSANGYEDIPSFIESICQVGCHINDKKLVETFVYEELKAIQEFEQLNLPLLKPKDANQSEFIPCFDSQNRAWYGLQSNELEVTYLKLLNKYKVTTLPNTSLLDLHVLNNQIQGITILHDDHIHTYSCKALVLATGGVGNVYKQSLNTSDISGVAHYLCAKNGCSLVNMEFIQMMFGYKQPAYKTIYNEKVFQYTDFYSNGNKLKLDSTLLKQRSTYGPFTSRLDSKEIDITLVKQLQQATVEAHYQPRLKNNNAEFIQTYFQWLNQNKQIGIDDPFELDVFYHAANGGVQINERSETSIHGVYACGELAGGIHGADRIGGLASASAITFGRIAGKQAAIYATTYNESNFTIEPTFYQIIDDKAYHKKIQELMQEQVLVIRNQQGLESALHQLKEMEQQFEYKRCTLPSNIKSTIALQSQLLIAKAMIQSCLLRKESRGSHYREDYSTINSTMEKRIISKYLNNQLISEWEE